VVLRLSPLDADVGFMAFEDEETPQLQLMSRAYSNMTGAFLDLTANEYSEMQHQACRGQLELRKSFCPCGEKRCNEGVPAA
jgi:hypothetical protein